MISCPSRGGRGQASTSPFLQQNSSWIPSPIGIYGNKDSLLGAQAPSPASVLEHAKGLFALESAQCRQGCLRSQLKITPNQNCSYSIEVLLRGLTGEPIAFVLWCERDISIPKSRRSYMNARISFRANERNSSSLL